MKNILFSGAAIIAVAVTIIADDSGPVKETPLPTAGGSENGNTVTPGQWGVTVSPLTKCYTRNGKMLGELKPGKLLDIEEVTNTKAGEVALCFPVESIGLKSEFVVRTFDIVIYPGRLADVDGETKKLCLQDAFLRSRIEQEKKNLVAQAEARNPYAAQYTTAKDAHEKYWVKVKDLQAKRDSNKGGDLMKYADELRRLKGQDIALANTLEKAKEKYDGWKAQNKIDESALTSPRLEAMQKELSAVQAKLSGEKIQ